MNMPHTHSPLATKAQIRLLTGLIAKHEVPVKLVETLRDRYRARTLTREFMSATLTAIDSLPLKSTEDINVTQAVVLLYNRTLIRVAPTNDGGYRTSLFKSRNGKRAEFVDRHVPVAILRQSRELTDSEIGKFTQSTGFCGRCGFKAVGRGSKSHTECHNRHIATQKGY